MISILLPDLCGGGAERVMIDLAQEFVRLGQAVEFVVMQATGEFLPEATRDFSVVDLAKSRTRHVPLDFARYLRHRKPDAIIANMWPLTSAAVVGKALSQWPCRLLVVEHNTLTQQYAGWGGLHSLLLSASMAGTYRFSDCIAAVSSGAATDTARLAGVHPSLVSVLHNPIPQRLTPSREACASAAALWGCAPGKRILTVGNLKGQKNQSLLLRAFASKGSVDARLMLLGQGNNEAALRDLSASLGIAERVIFAGFHPDPSPFYATADLFVLSSDYEGFGNVIVEAMSFGLPIVSTDCPSGPSEILENGKFGRLVPVGDAGALATAMEEALGAPVEREALITRSKDFSPEIAARKYLDLLGLA